MLSDAEYVSKLAAWVGDRGNDLVTILSEAYAGRPYHNLGHIKGMTEFCAEAQVSDHRALDLAIAFHDFVYVSGAPDNEELSAQAAVTILPAFGSFGPDELDAITALILVTKHHRPLELDSKLYDASCWIIDADLMGFARDAKSNLALVREEFSQVGERDWIVGRLEWLEEFVRERQPFYLVPVNQSLYGALARSNIDSEIADLRDQLKLV